MYVRCFRFLWFYWPLSLEKQDLTHQKHKNPQGDPGADGAFAAAGQACPQATSIEANEKKLQQLKVPICCMLRGVTQATRRTISSLLGGTNICFVCICSFFKVYAKRSRPESYQMVDLCRLMFGSPFHSCHGNLHR